VNQHGQDAPIHAAMRGPSTVLGELASGEILPVRTRRREAQALPREEN
jgi:hypothetical protein